MPWLRGIVAGLLPRRSEFNYRLIHVGFVGNVTRGNVWRQVLGSYPDVIITAMLHTHSFLCHRHYILLALLALLNKIHTQKDIKGSCKGIYAVVSAVVVLEKYEYL
jgi:hypothetical protein